MTSLYSWLEWNARVSIQNMVDLWNEAMFHHFPLSKELFERNVFHPFYLDLARSCLVIENGKLIGFTVAKSDTHKILSNDTCLWISCIVVHPDYQRKGIGTKMVNHTLSTVRCNVIVGSDPHHFFPGIPSENTTAQLFFEKQGFTIEGKAYDLRCNISKYKYTTLPMKDDYLVQRLLPKHQGELLQHLEENHSTRWYKETKWSINYEKDIFSLVGLFHKGNLIGFAHVHSKNDSFWIPSVYWGKYHNQNIGGLGPVGIHKDYRGAGVGSFFMMEILKLLQREGVNEMEIDWTILLDFYKKFHFVPHRSYVHAKRTNK
ncbi:GNAT family N-acetyltransferase [Evansella sp. AB-rgal1]|uniref:GNAT family N-acetyltransferase n=1 Tax=Evansella sp. AB-rgal1 TaxID=3242696 RepID=UPI00359DE54A